MTVGTLTARKKKLILAGIVGLVAALGELSQQMVAGTLNLTRIAIVGTGIGLLVRVAGAVLATYVETTPAESKPSIDSGAR